MISSLPFTFDWNMTPIHQYSSIQITEPTFPDGRPKHIKVAVNEGPKSTPFIKQDQHLTQIWKHEVGCVKIVTFSIKTTFNHPSEI